MVTTFLDYNLITRDMNRSMERIASQALVQREAEYYRDNIGRIGSVDEFLDDYRLYSYAMKAYGLEDMTYAVAFMRHVLESDLTDAESFANKLTDERYRKFAEAFAFPGSGFGVTVDLQSDRQEEDLVGLYTARAADEGAAYAREYDYYRARIGEIDSVDEFLADRRLTEFALDAVGLDTRYYSSATLREVLTGDPDDPDGIIQELDRWAYRELNRLFNFGADGSVPAEGAQTAEQVDDITTLYLTEVPDRIIPLAAELNQAYFEDRLGAVTNVDDLITDPRMVSYLRTAYQLPVVAGGLDELRAALTSYLSDPGNFAVTNGSRAYIEIAGLFNFNPDGSLDAGVAAQTSEQTAALNARYQTNYDTSGLTRDESRSTTFRSATQIIFSVEDFLANTTVYDYALRAVGLDPDTVSKDVIRQTLTSDLGDPNSFANRQLDTSYRLLASSFNFASDGTVTTARRAQSTGEVNDLVNSFNARRELLDLSEEQAEAEVAYYREAIEQIGSVDDLLDNDRLLAFIFNARGVELGTLDRETVRSILTSDVFDPASFANEYPDRSMRSLAASFNFDQDGMIMREMANVSQSRADLIATQEAYLRQSLEIEAGEDNEGVRLALYFQRMASTISSPFDLLADPALMEVVRVSLGLPEEIGQADIDAQAAMIEDRIDLADFSDPEKVEEFVRKFSALYDIENASSRDPILALFSNSGGAGLGADMLSSLARLKTRGI